MKRTVALHTEEIHDAMSHGNYAASWRAARQLAAAVKGSRRKLAAAPRNLPRAADILAKYSKPAVNGGWHAVEISQDRIQQLEPDFSDVHVVRDASNDSTFTLQTSLGLRG